MIKNVTNECFCINWNKWNTGGYFGELKERNLNEDEGKSYRAAIQRLCQKNS